VVDRVLGRLAGASLLTFNVAGTTVNAHRLVMRVIRERLAARGCLTRVCVAVAKVLDGLAGSLRESWHGDRPAVRDLIEQITALGDSTNRCPADEDLARRMIQLRWWAVFYLNELGDNPAQAIMIGQQLLADQVQLLSPGHPDILASRSILAIAYQAAGRTGDAITLFELILAQMERLLGSDDPDTLASRNNLANAYRDVGRAAEAITLFEQTLTEMERLLGSDHPRTLASRNNLALAYQAAGRTAEAITLHERTLAEMERLLGSDHPDTLASRNNLALAYQAAGRAAEAISLHEQASILPQDSTSGPSDP
jgi:tetratricopeptide (TPR) repeat protein